MNVLYAIRKHIHWLSQCTFPTKCSILPKTQLWFLSSRGWKPLAVIEIRTGRDKIIFKQVKLFIRPFFDV